jgi:hypothetical protein
LHFDGCLAIGDFAVVIGGHEDKELHAPALGHLRFKGFLVCGPGFQVELQRL